MTDKITHTNSHGLIDTDKTDKEWLDEFIKKMIHTATDGRTTYDDREIDRLVAMAREANNSSPEDIEAVDDLIRESSRRLEQLVKYENALKGIQSYVVKRMLWNVEQLDGEGHYDDLAQLNCDIADALGDGKK